MPSRISVAAIALMVGLVVAAPRANAQDAHYWAQQFGTRSTLLGGVVIGTVADLSATYYNPGAVALATRKSLLLAANVYELQTLKVDGDAGIFDGLTSSQFKPVPGIFAGTLSFDKLAKHKFAYSFIARQRFRAEFSAWGNDSLDVMPTPGNEFVTAQIKFEQKLSEYWAGFTYAYALNDSFGVGVTTYFAYRQQRSEYLLLLQALDSNDGYSGNIATDFFDYNNLRLLWKAGANWRGDKLDVGVNLTTASIDLLGSGSAGINRTVVNEDVTGDGNPDNIILNEVAEDVSSTFKSGWAAGLGLGYRFNRITVSFSTEWFDAVPTFRVLDIPPTASGNPLTPEPGLIDVTLESVVNFGVGLRWDNGRRFNGYLSLITDFSALPPDDNTRILLANWDLYHAAGGASFQFDRWVFTTGIEYAFGSREVAASGENLGGGNLPSLPENAKFRYSRLQVLLGFNLLF